MFITTAFPSKGLSPRPSWRSSTLLDRIAGKPLGQLIGDVHHSEVTIYQATEYREQEISERLRYAQQQAGAVRLRLLLEASRVRKVLTISDSEAV